MSTEINTPKPMTEKEFETYKLHRRFDRIGRLIGDDGMKALFNSHVFVIGLGGVGSWAAEALARSGVGELTIVDFDEVCITNFNRQLHALQGHVGQNKTDIMAERLLKINPQLKVNPIKKFYNERLNPEIFTVRPDYVLDAIDNVTAKCHLIYYCVSQKIPIITSTGSGGRLDPTQIEITDLAFTTNDGLAKAVRRILREQYNFPKDKNTPFNVPAVYSKEPAMLPKELAYDNGKGFRCVCTTQDNPYFNCDNRNLIYGNAAFVTGAFGFAAASHIVKDLLTLKQKN
jgi:tRNA A37 threonylcarbamoyladenosine dehydratase